jgi:hypothetical protein
MKNLKLTFLVAFIAIGAFVISSCSPTDDPELKPVLNFLAGAGYTSDDATITAGENFKVGLSASHDSKIETLKIRVSFDGGADVIPDNCSACDTTINESTFTMDFENSVESKAGTETWSFTVTDKSGNATTRKIKFTRTKVPVAIRTIAATLGNQNSATVGSSLKLEDISVLLLSDAKTGSESIDLIYVSDDLDGSILCSPSSAIAAAKLEGASGVETWATRNATKIRLTSITSNDFSAMTDSKELIAEIASSAATTDKVINLAAGNVYFVEPVSADGRFALIKINSIDVDNTMTVDVLVEDL